MNVTHVFYHINRFSFVKRPTKAAAIQPAVLTHKTHTHFSLYTERCMANVAFAFSLCLSAIDQNINVHLLLAMV